MFIYRLEGRNVAARTGAFSQNTMGSVKESNKRSTINESCQLLVVSRQLFV